MIVKKIIPGRNGLSSLICIDSDGNEKQICILSSDGSPKMIDKEVEITEDGKVAIVKKEETNEHATKKKSLFKKV